jgi:UDP-N-acetylmuramate dehydrogenase
MDNMYRKLLQDLNGQFYENYQIANVAFYKLGGSIDIYAIPESKADLITLIQRCKETDVPYFIFGKGSNLLISDEGYRGVFISLEKSCNELQLNNKISRVGAGVILWDLVKETMNVSLGDMSNMSWIPGTVGGALYMNAGAFGTEIESFVESVEVISPEGEHKHLSKEECAFVYRNSGLQRGFTVLAAKMKFQDSDRRKMRENSRAIIERRKSKQPLEYPSCGSVFKRPAGLYAGTLIEECGLKGFRIGGAEVSQKHANFILNKKAKSKDVYQIIKHVIQTVIDKKGVQLEREVRLVGFNDEII